jgi:hypothetical protein
MRASVTCVSGPRRSGKSALIRTMVDQLCSEPPHYIRLISRLSDKERPQRTTKVPQEYGVASATWLEYTPDDIFEVLPATLSRLRQRDRHAAVVIEADADPALRCAYPYDFRVFVMSIPQSVPEVFRTAEAAARELQRALDDTMSFASEIFGLLADDADMDRDFHEERPALTLAQMRGFLHSPLGDELATRIQLQPPYHGLVESDVVVINADGTPPSKASEECVRRIERLFERLRRISGPRAEVFLCDPRNYNNKMCKKMLRALEPMCTHGPSRLPVSLPQCE